MTPPPRTQNLKMFDSLYHRQVSLSDEKSWCLLLNKTFVMKWKEIMSADSAEHTWRMIGLKIRLSVYWWLQFGANHKIAVGMSAHIGKVIVASISSCPLCAVLCQTSSAKFSISDLSKKIGKSGPQSFCVFGRLDQYFIAHHPSWMWGQSFSITSFSLGGGGTLTVTDM